MLPDRIKSDMTLYNLFENAEGQPSMQVAWLDGIFWQGNYGMQMAAMGRATTDRIKVIIPLSLLESEGRQYVESHEWLQMPELLRSQYWTLTKGDKMINRLVVEHFERPIELDKRFGSQVVFTITEIAVHNYGSPAMQHFEITAR